MGKNVEFKVTLVRVEVKGSCPLRGTSRHYCTPSFSPAASTFVLPCQHHRSPGTDTIASASTSTRASGAKGKDKGISTSGAKAEAKGKGKKYLQQYKQKPSPAPDGSCRRRFRSHLSQTSYQHSLQLMDG